CSRRCDDTGCEKRIFAAERTPVMSEDHMHSTSTPIAAATKRDPQYELVRPRTFDPARHFYPRVLNAQMHSLVRYFLTLDNDRIIRRYCHLNPRTSEEMLG